MKQNISEFNQKFKDELLDVGYKHVAMDSAEGERIVSYNQPAQKIQNKFNEIQKRLRVLPDGYYRIYCTYSYGSKAKPDMFLIKKGKVSDETLQEPIKPQEHAIIPISKEQIKREEILSLEQALTRIEQLSRLEMENSVLKDKVKQQADELLELESELSEMEEKQPLADNGMNGIGGWLKEIAPVLAPIADQYFELEKQKVALAEKRFHHQQKKQPIIVRNQRQRQQPKKPTLQEIIMSIDVNNEDVMNRLYDELDEMEEDNFNATLKQIESLRPDVAELIIDEFGLVEEEEESNE